jgi:DNA-binding Lrp family transcriptional regulator
VIQKLRHNYGLMLRPYTNCFAIGCQSVAIYSATATVTKKRRALLEKFVAADQHVMWCSEFLGDYHLGFTLLCRNINEIPVFLDRLVDRTGIEFADRIISYRIRYVYFNRKYLSPGRKPVTTELSAPKIPIQVDELDAKLLNHLAQANYASLRDVARQLGEPPATIDRRYQKLKQAGMFPGTLVDFNPIHLGRRAYRILLLTRGMTREEKLKLFNFCRDHDQVICYIEALGQFDIEIIVELEHAEDVVTIVQSLNEEFGEHIHSSATLGEAHNIRWSLFPGVY